MSTSAGTTETYYVYNGRDVELEFRDDDGPSGPDAPMLVARNLFGPAVDEILAQEDSLGRVVWTLDDHLGTIRDLIDSSGTVVDHITYDSSGKILSQTDATRSIGYGFTGREFDAETGLQYNRARYYDPGTGRFLSEDPSGFDSGTVNFYAYVGNDLIDQFDPFGLDKCDDLQKQLGLTDAEVKKLLDLAKQYQGLERLKESRRLLQHGPNASVGHDAQGNIVVVPGRVTTGGFRPLAPLGPGPKSGPRPVLSRPQPADRGRTHQLTNSAPHPGCWRKASTCSRTSLRASSNS